MLEDLIKEEGDMKAKSVPNDVKQNENGVTSSIVNYCAVSILEKNLLTNEKIGQLFWFSYSSVSYIVKAVQARVKKDRKFSEKLNRLNSQFKMWHRSYALCRAARRTFCALLG